MSFNDFMSKEAKLREAEEAEKGKTADTSKEEKSATEERAIKIVAN